MFPPTAAQTAVDADKYNLDVNSEPLNCACVTSSGASMCASGSVAKQRCHSRSYSLVS